MKHKTLDLSLTPPFVSLFIVI